MGGVTEDAEHVSCWCCGGDYDEREVVRLGAHPEVAICLRCTVFLRQNAGARQDELHPTMGAKARTGVRQARGWVMRHDWHHNPVVGPILRRVNRHLP